MLPLLALASTVLRVGMIPDVNPGAIIRNSKPLVAYLEKATGAKVKLTVPTNYASVVAALAAHQLDVAYLGGFTFLQARARSGVVPLVQRTTDRQFQSLFITQASSPIHSLSDLAGHTWAYGDVNSTSGHLMPAFYLDQSHLGDKLSHVAFSGGHEATGLAVANGKVDAGAIDETVYHKMLATGLIKAGQTRVFWTTPPFADYVWVAAKSLAPSLRTEVAEAFLHLTPSREPDRDILALLRGKKYVRATVGEYTQLAAAGKHEGLLK
ncbi:MAG: phosphate/phosphite/phosphonate ABC transporter substrate-binding protein [Cyanobacteria bacterium REEB65]|nr:phosphate/phosphite/phosphonate ABC transporter substrate-binding protein [Cyanobacteria bacterium REEB65]